MAKNISEQILSEALRLPPTERAELIENLFSSFEFPSRGKIDELWAQEAERRINEFEKGMISAAPARDVLTDVEK